MTILSKPLIQEDESLFENSDLYENADSEESEWLNPLLPSQVIDWDKYMEGLVAIGGGHGHDEFESYTLEY